MKKKLLLIIMILFSTLYIGIINVKALGVSSYNELNSCLLQENKCKLLNDISNSSDNISLNVTKNFTLDLNGKKLNNYSISVSNNAILTLESTSNGGSIETTAESGITLNNATFIANGGKVIGSEYGVKASNSIVTINDGEFIGNGLDYHTAGLFTTAKTKTIINGGKFWSKPGYSTGNFSGGSGAHFYSNGGVVSTIINGGYFSGIEGVLNESADIEINDGEFIGDSSGIWLSHPYRYSNYVPMTNINGGNFSGRTAIRVAGANKNIITGGIFKGENYGLFIECKNEKQCLNSITLNGGKYSNVQTTNAEFYPNSAIILISDLDKKLKIDELIGNGFVLSYNELLEKESESYGYFSYTKSNNVSIIKKVDQVLNNSELINSTTEKNKNAIIYNPKTSDMNIYIALLVIGLFTGIIILSSKRLKKIK